MAYLGVQLAIYTFALALCTRIVKKPFVISTYNGNCIKLTFFVERVHMCFEGHCRCETTLG